ncbi:GNAT family N-acetyltransferase [Camelliibacillus cellulosilyticus]|uniref:GNAT family N-acetyltransferase n=1 Tax=Camelliibacillus cellulosilyticus TaxID=2174486 RepID=A0ABV9GN84_9BACL
MTEKIYVKVLEVNDAEALLALEVKNRDFFQTYAPLREAEFFTVEEQRRRLDEGGEDTAFGIFLSETHELIGKVALTEVARGPYQSAWIGYYLDKAHNGKGYMTEAVRQVVDYAFQTLKLHRVEAGVMPHNIGSIRVLEKAGFQKEGIARENVKINGEWKDHQILAIINEAQA